MNNLRLSVVVPVYGCVGCLEQLCARLVTVLSPITSWYEILLVDDRSPDQAWPVIQQLRQQYPAVRGLLLSRNFGQHIAITAGLGAARGDAVVVMDCDLQDPPEAIPALVTEWNKGYDLVMGKRRRQGSHSAFRLMASTFYFKLLSALSEQRIDSSQGTFTLLSRKVVDAFLKFNERDRHYLFVLRWLGFHAGVVEYDHAERTIGCSAYSLRRLLRHAFGGVFFHSTAFLRWIVGVGLIFAAAGAFFACYLVVRYFIGGGVAGWTSLAVLLLICTGTMLTCMGVVGLYVGKIFEQTKGRPLYVIDRDTGEVP